MEQEVEKFHTSLQKSAEDEDWRAWEVMMKGIHGQIPRK